MAHAKNSISSNITLTYQTKHRYKKKKVYKKINLPTPCFHLKRIRFDHPGLRFTLTGRRERNATELRFKADFRYRSGSLPLLLPPTLLSSVIPGLTVARASFPEQLWSQRFLLLPFCFSLIAVCSLSFVSFHPRSICLHCVHHPSRNLAISRDRRLLTDLRLLAEITMTQIRNWKKTRHNFLKLLFSF